MHTAPFRYLRAKSTGEAEALFKNASDARFVAGGQSLIPMMKQRLAAPAELIDLSRISSLAFIRREGGTLVIGAGTTHADVAASAEVMAAIPALARLALGIGDPAVRHRGTLGGSIANNDPAADYPAAVLALNAHVKTTGRLIDGDVHRHVRDRAARRRDRDRGFVPDSETGGLREIPQPGLALRHGRRLRRSLR